MKVSAADLADRYSILVLKAKNLPDDRAIAQELSQYHEAVIKESIDPEIIRSLLEINGSIWNLESDIRQGKEGLLGLEEVGRRALKIRDLNRERIAIKNRIATERWDHRERKINHVSEVASASNAPTVAHERRG